MRKALLIFIIIFSSVAVHAQHFYPEITSYGGGATPTHGLKIKTNLPYTNSSQMPTIFIKGYNYNTSEPISITLVWYIINGNFYHYGASSAGSYTPEIKLANENSKVVIYLNDRQYFQRFYISAFAKKNEAPAWFTGWTIVDEPISGTNEVTVPYRQRLAGDIRLPGGIWNKEGNVGIGTSNLRDDKLAVNGKIRAREVKVEVSNWPDYVFDADYDLIPLSEVAHYIEDNRHLPGVPSKSQVEADGISLGKMDAILLKKIEELMLYLIQQEEQIHELQREITNLKRQNSQ